jgi:hypothetical protein
MKSTALFVAGLFAITLASTSASGFSISQCQDAVCDGLGIPHGTATQGWDGPGLGSATIDYYVGSPSQPNGGLPSGFSLATFEPVLNAAMGTWSSAVDVTFNRIGDFTDGGTNQFQSNSIDIYFASLDHGDGNPFDGAWNPATGTGSVFAHAWGPNDIWGEPVAGNMHFDADEDWVTTGTVVGATMASIDLESILLHELGHVLGLGHEDSMGSGIGAPIMQSFHNVDGTWARTLTADDIAGVQTLYAAVGDNDGGVIPEPSTIVLFGAGLMGFGLAARKGYSQH